jgi:hypothetical protein
VGGLAVDDTNVYWLVYDNGQPVTLELWTAPKTPNATANVLVPLRHDDHASLGVPTDLVVDATNIYWLDNNDGGLPPSLFAVAKAGPPINRQDFDNPSTRHLRTLVQSGTELFFLADDGIHRDSTDLDNTDQVVLPTDGTTLAGLAVNARDIYWGTQGPKSTGSVSCMSR